MRHSESALCAANMPPFAAAQRLAKTELNCHDITTWARAPMVGGSSQRPSSRAWLERRPQKQARNGLLHGNTSLAGGSQIAESFGLAMD